MSAQGDKRRARSSGATRRSAKPGGAESSRRALWRGSLGFGLVQVPVALVPAETSRELAFHELDKHDLSRIGYLRINKSTGKPVDWKDIVKGYEIEKGRFVVLEPEDFRKANVAATQSIDILDFVRGDEIPLTYFERPYYILPEARGLKAYAVLRDALVKTGYTAIALVVIRTRQHLCAVMPQRDAGPSGVHPAKAPRSEPGLVLEILRFPHELQPMVSSVAPSNARPNSRDVAMAEKLIEGMLSPWDPAKYRDTYTDDLLAAIREKDKTGQVRAEAAPKGITKLADLSDLLRKSVALAKRGGRSQGKQTNAA